MKKNIALTMMAGMAAMMASSQTTNDTTITPHPLDGMGYKNLFVGGSSFGFRIPFNIPNQRQRRRNERRNPSLRRKK